MAAHVNLLNVTRVVRYAMSPAAENPYLCMSAGAVGGEVAVYDLSQAKALSTFQSHDSPIHLMAFNDTGGLLASASTKVVERDRIFRGR